MFPFLLPLRCWRTLLACLLVAGAVQAQDTTDFRIGIYHPVEDIVPSAAEVMIDGQKARFNSKMQMFEARVPVEKQIEVQLAYPDYAPFQMQLVTHWASNAEGMLMVQLGKPGTYYLRSSHLVLNYDPDSSKIGITAPVGVTDTSWKNDTHLARLLDSLDLKVVPSIVFRALGARPITRYISLQKKNGSKFGDDLGKICTQIAPAGYTPGVFLNKNSPVLSTFAAEVGIYPSSFPQHVLAWVQRSAWRFEFPLPLQPGFTGNLHLLPLQYPKNYAEMFSQLQKLWQEKTVQWVSPGSVVMNFHDFD